jgi:hypothetical protein
MAVPQIRPKRHSEPSRQRLQPPGARTSSITSDLSAATSAGRSGDAIGNLCASRVWLEEEDDRLFLFFFFLEIFLLLLELTSVFSNFLIWAASSVMPHHPDR